MTKTRHIFNSAGDYPGATPTTLRSGPDVSMAATIDALRDNLAPLGQGGPGCRSVVAPGFLSQTQFSIPFLLLTTRRKGGKIQVKFTKIS